MSIHKKNKICSYCGRMFSWRKKWELNWDEVKYCSTKCGGANKGEVELFKNKILSLLETRGTSSSICPSEVLKNDEKKNKALMEKVRCAARLLAHEGKLKITQKSKVIDPSTIKGPIRIKKI